MNNNILPEDELNEKYLNDLEAEASKVVKQLGWTDDGTAESEDIKRAFKMGVLWKSKWDKQTTNKEQVGPGEGSSDIAKSNKTVASDGEIIVDVTEGTEVPCPTCNGKGKIINPNRPPGNYRYYTRAVDKHCECRTCNGSGWVFVKSLETIFSPAIAAIIKRKQQ